MNRNIDERITALAENQLMKELFAADEITFKQMFEIIRQKRFERLGLKRITPVDSLEKSLEAKASAAAAVKTPDALTKGAPAEKIGAPGAACEGIEK